MIESMSNFSVSPEHLQIIIIINKSLFYFLYRVKCKKKKTALLMYKPLTSCKHQIPPEMTVFDVKYSIRPVDWSCKRDGAEWINVAHAGACEMTAREMLRSVIPASRPLASSTSPYHRRTCPESVRQGQSGACTRTQNEGSRWNDPSKKAHETQESHG